MTGLILVALGGALGALARHGVGWLALRHGPHAWPVGTLTVNIVGSLAMGLLAGWLAFRGTGAGEPLRLFLATGLLGGFTTFSAFSLETALMIERGELARAGAYAAGSLVLGVAALFLGLMVARRLFA